MSRIILRRPANVTWLLLPMLGLVSTVGAASEITRPRSIPAANIQSLSLQVGVGGLSIKFTP